MHDELHQALAGRRTARIDQSLIDGPDHRTLRQEPGTGVRDGLGKIVERRAADMNVAGLICI